MASILRFVSDLLSYGIRSDAFYLAKQRQPTNEVVCLTEVNGLCDVCTFGTPELQLPGDILQFLAEEHNRWHGGAAANLVQQLNWIKQADDEWLEHADANGWKRSNLPTTGEGTWAKLAWEHVSSLITWQERLPGEAKHFY